jgi:ATP-dependent 26S proteasome regulatory subunit
MEGSYWSCKAVCYERKYRKWRGNNFDVYLRKNYFKINLILLLLSQFRRVSWDEVGGLEEARMYIRRSVEWPLKHPEAFERLNVPRPKGVLIYGPPGCGKSLLVRAAATSCTASFLSISAAELFSPFVGDSEKMVSDLFRRARQAVPAILFLDELGNLINPSEFYENILILLIL